MDDPRIAAFQQEVEKVLQYLLAEFSKLQTGRANASLVEHVMVEAYGQLQPLKAVAGISVQDAKTIVIQPWDKSIGQEIEKAISKADLGMSPVNDGIVIRITLPSMNEERRTSLVKVVDQLAEEARISIRQQRQHAHDHIKTAETDEDRKFTLLEEIDKKVKGANDKVEELRAKKEKEVMTV